jgi:hypothetical protein
LDFQVKLAVTLLLSFTFFLLQAQKLVDVGNVPKAKLKEAGMVSDIVKDYPKSKTVVVEITGMTGGRAVSARSSSPQLTTEQKLLLSGVDKGSKLYIDILPDGSRSRKVSYLVHPSD